jgi:hypothetical protein
MADERSPAGNTEKRVYQIWHDPGGHPSKMFEIRHGLHLAFPGGYVHVANVRASSLKEAAELATTDFDSKASPLTFWKEWKDKPGVETFKIPGMERLRDLWGGDVIVSPGGQPYRYDELDGFTAIPRQPDLAHPAPFQQGDDAKGSDRRPPRSLTRQIPALLRTAIARVSSFLKPSITHPPPGRDEGMHVAEAAAPRLRMNHAADSYAGLMNDLEAFADEFDRLALTAEQKALTKAFGQYVAGEAHGTIKYLTAEALRPDSAPDPAHRAQFQKRDPDKGLDR